MENNCLFCKIVKGEIPCNKVYEDDNVLAFYDIKPSAKIHVLVIPKKHIDSFNDIDKLGAESISDMMIAVSKIATILGIEKDGYKVITNIGENGGQEIKHLHFHILGGEKL